MTNNISLKHIGKKVKIVNKDNKEYIGILKDIEYWHIGYTLFTLQLENGIIYFKDKVIQTINVIN
jgi:RNase P/RNase MRP subunit p29